MNNWKNLLRAVLIGVASRVLDLGVRGYVFAVLVITALLLTDWIAEDEAKERVADLVRRLTSRRAA